LQQHHANSGHQAAGGQLAGTQRQRAVTLLAMAGLPGRKFRTPIVEFAVAQWPSGVKILP
jgi:hypothetical protein